MPTHDITQFTPRTGRVIKENGETINVGDGYPIAYSDVDTSLITKVNGNDGAIHSMDYKDAIGLRKIPGHSLFRGFGRRSALSTVSTGDDLWNGTATTIPFPDQSVGEQMTIVSTAAADSSAGANIRTVDIHYIDANGAEQEEIITLNGVTPVNTVATNIRHVQFIHANTVGTFGGAAAGTISLYKTGSASTIYAQIEIGTNVSVCSRRMVPAGKSFYLNSISVSGTSSKPLIIALRATCDYIGDLTPGVFIFNEIYDVQDSMNALSINPPRYIPALAFLKGTAYSTQVGGAATISYGGWIE